MTRARPVFSPNGEVLSSGGRGAPDCQTALSDWWDRMMAGRAGGIDKAMFLADAEALFVEMDLDHDGFITSSELSEYRAAADEPVLDDVPAIGPDGTPQSTDTRPATRPIRRGRNGGASGDSGGQRSVSTGQMSPDVVDPVMSADRSLSFKVSREDFMAQAHEVFATLDSNHDGQISRDELLASCPAKK